MILPLLVKPLYGLQGCFVSAQQLFVIILALTANTSGPWCNSFANCVKPIEIYFISTEVCTWSYLAVKTPQMMFGVSSWSHETVRTLHLAVAENVRSVIANTCLAETEGRYKPHNTGLFESAGNHTHASIANNRSKIFLGTLEIFLLRMPSYVRV